MNLIESITKRLVTHDSQLAGKTIHVAVATDNKLYVAFEDGSLMLASAGRGYGDDAEIQIRAFVDGYVDLPNWVDLGVVNQSDFAEWQEERRTANKTSEEKRERREYERLKAKFSNPG